MFGENWFLDGFWTGSATFRAFAVGFEARFGGILARFWVIVFGENSFLDDFWTGSATYCAFAVGSEGRFVGFGHIRRRFAPLLGDLRRYLAGFADIWRDFVAFVPYFCGKICL